MHMFGEALLAIMAIMTMYDLYWMDIVLVQIFIHLNARFFQYFLSSNLYSIFNKPSMQSNIIQGVARPTAHFPPRQFRRV